MDMNIHFRVNLCEMSSFFHRYLLFSNRRAEWILGIALGLAVLASVPTSRLGVQTDMMELLPQDHPVVQAFRQIAGRQRASNRLIVLVHSPEAAADRRFVEDLHTELRKRVPEFWSDVQRGPSSEMAAHLWRWRWLYTEITTLRRADTLLERMIQQRKNPLLLDLEEDPKKEMQGLQQELSKSFPSGKEARYFESQTHSMHYMAVLLTCEWKGVASPEDRRVLAKVQAIVHELQPQRYHPHMQVDYTGILANVLYEQDGLSRDLVRATMLCVVLVFLAIYLYFHRFALLFVIGVPAFLGVLFALCLAKSTMHSLNLNTAFLVPIVLGNGINTPIVLLSRYGEERQQGRDLHQSLLSALQGTWLGTATATLAASLAYGCLILTHFRGVVQFGVLGSVGMLLAWLFAFLLVPPLVLLGERFFPGRFTPRGRLWQRPFAALGSCMKRFPWVFALVVSGLVVGALPLCVRYLKNPCEWNFRKLYAHEPPWRKGQPSLEALGLGEGGNGSLDGGGIVLVEKPEQAEVVAQALQEHAEALGEKSLVKAVRTLRSFLPSAQEEKLSLLTKMREKIDQYAPYMTAEERREIEGLRPPEGLRVLTVEDLPASLQEAFTEIDGQRGRLVGIELNPKVFRKDNGLDLLRASRVLRVQTLGRTWTASSSSALFASIIETLLADGPLVALASLYAIATLLLLLFSRGWVRILAVSGLLVGGVLWVTGWVPLRYAWCPVVGILFVEFVLLRTKGTLPVLTSLAVGLVGLGGLLGALVFENVSLKIHFINFVAFPITLGIGTEYTANLWSRLRQEGNEGIVHVIAHTGSAIALCSLTTLIGYGSLLLSTHRALRSFGAVATLGELTCVLAALCVLPLVALGVQTKP